MDTLELLVVGDRFRGFAEGKSNVCTISDFKAMAHRGVISDGTRVMIGQGVEHDPFHGAIAHFRARHNASIDVGNVDQINDQVDPDHQGTVHKANPENMLVSRPIMQSDGSCVAWLSIQDRNELVLDHMTGQHIQGMVLTEAARQMFLSVSEHYLLDDEQRGKCYFVINSLSTEFSRFAFPLPTSVVFRMGSEDRRPSKSLRVKCSIEFHQTQDSGSLVATVHADYTAFDADVISKKEAVLAASVMGLFAISSAPTVSLVEQVVALVG